MIYVDDILEHGVRVGSIRGKSCHMFCVGTEGELHRFALSIGLKRGWCSDYTQPGSRHLHYDLTPYMRRMAVASGAIPVTRREEFDLLAKAVKQMR